MIKYCVDMFSTARAAVEKPKLWEAGDTISIAFLGGTLKLKQRVEEAACQWLDHLNLSFRFKDTPAQVRISFRKNGSWSYIGKDCLAIPDPTATMNFGWFEDSTPREEIGRTVLHEFGHMLGMIHEHQNPDANIQWNKDAVYDYYLSPQIGWSAEDVDNNLFAKYNSAQTNFSKFDPQSIMLYPIPARFTTDGFQVGWNTLLSDMDKEFMGEMYG